MCRFLNAITPLVLMAFLLTSVAEAQAPNQPKSKETL
jgi:hypothetical protein